jgi:hypothetical protein
VIGGHPAVGTLAAMSSLVDTRNALHDVARFVLAADLEGTTELVTLRAADGGFAQPERLVDGLQRRIRIDGTALVVQHGENEEWAPLTTLGAAAESASVSLPTDAPAADKALEIDATHAELLAEFFALTHSALAEFRRRHAGERPTIAQLFPHHFDLAITMQEVNFGGSPGDKDHDEPYLYVGPWSLSPHSEWNEAWGASMPWSQQTTAEQAIEFFERGLSAARHVFGV